MTSAHRSPTTALLLGLVIYFAYGYKHSRVRLDAVARALLENETIDGEEYPVLGGPFEDGTRARAKRASSVLCVCSIEQNY